MYFSYSQTIGQKHEKKRVIFPYYKEHMNRNLKTLTDERRKKRNTKIRKEDRKKEQSKAALK
jgi:glycogen synthase